ncbi:helix-turn-helix domain-containing protein [Trinickia mobilis]|uniref:helix-turn-helix domain-containing protein n=1 Tax=Trinickia mobilis TaxID=2816356 RepID=UPI001A8FD243|nr:helix-turn-helix transcriptional regulator [Trinickia mobilis]
MPKSVSGLAETLRSRRDELGLSQESLARATGLSRSVVSRMERNAGNPLLSTLEILAMGLDLDVRILLAPEPNSKLVKSNQTPLVRVGGNIHRLRKKIGKRGLSQEKLSMLSGHFRTYITELEMARNSPSIADLESIADQLGVQVIDLLEPLDEVDYQTRVERFEKAGGDPQGKESSQ